MSVDDYEEIRSEPDHFAVLVGHEILDAERVIAERESYLIVEKYGDAGRVATAGDPRNHLKTCRVVVIDDTPEIRYLLKMLLAIEPSCTVVGEAGNGAEGIDVVDQTKPELVVLDLEMPTMDGWHALPHLRRVSPTTHIIVFSSTETDARMEKRLRNLGADRIVKKGGDPNIIMDAIRDIALGGRDRTFDGGERAGRQADSRTDGPERRTPSRDADGAPTN
ncbi:MAG: putative two-component system response regulator [Thermoleophilia bacterium]|nr:putative two-component system response regulator [Thermoleophilia bacterium]